MLYLLPNASRMKETCKLHGGVCQFKQNKTTDSKLQSSLHVMAKLPLADCLFVVGFGFRGC